MSEKGYLEKRKFVRFVISIPLKYVKHNVIKILALCTHDISAQGANFISNEDIPVNSLLKLCLRIPDNNEEIPLDAEVVWIKKIEPSKYRCGLKIKDKQIKPIPLVLRTIHSQL